MKKHLITTVLTVAVAATTARLTTCKSVKNTFDGNELQQHIKRPLNSARINDSSHREKENIKVCISCAREWEEQHGYCAYCGSRALPLESFKRLYPGRYK